MDKQEGIVTSWFYGGDNFSIGQAQRLGYTTWDFIGVMRNINECSLRGITYRIYNLFEMLYSRKIQSLTRFIQNEQRWIFNQCRANNTNRC